MSECLAACVNPKDIPGIWPLVRGLIYEAMRRGDFGAFGPVEDDILNGDALLWVAYDEKQVAAACVTQISETEWRKVCTLVACGGSDMSRWLGILDQIEAYAKAEECSAMRIVGRCGWERVLTAYRQHRVVLERTL